MSKANSLISMLEEMNNQLNLRELALKEQVASLTQKNMALTD